MGEKEGRDGHGPESARFGGRATESARNGHAGNMKKSNRIHDIYRRNVNKMVETMIRSE